jgi:hypothetical protein
MSKKNTKEGKVKTECLEYLRFIGAFVWNNPTGAYQARPGSSLIVLLIQDNC